MSSDPLPPSYVSALVLNRERARYFGRLAVLGVAYLLHGHRHGKTKYLWTHGEWSWGLHGIRRNARFAAHGARVYLDEGGTVPPEGDDLLGDPIRNPSNY